jgi:hypothetical protein
VKPVVAPNGNRAARRTAGINHIRPAEDLALTRIAGTVYLGLRGAGFIRLSPAEARQLAAELAELADAQGDLS